MDNVAEHVCQSDHKKPVAVHPGQMICAGCIRRIRESLPEVARLWIAVQDLTGVMSTKKGEGGRRGPASQAPTDLDLIAMADMRTEYTPGSDIVPVVRWIYETARWIALDRRFRPGKSTIEQLATINRNIDYLSTRPYAPETVERFALMRMALRRQCGEVRNVIDRCQAPTDTGDDCGGPLFQAEDGSASVLCAKCGDRWTDGAVTVAYGELRRLGMILETGERAE